MRLRGLRSWNCWLASWLCFAVTERGSLRCVSHLLSQKQLGFGLIEIGGEIPRLFSAGETNPESIKKTQSVYEVCRYGKGKAVVLNQPRTNGRAAPERRGIQKPSSAFLHSLSLAEEMQMLSNPTGTFSGDNRYSSEVVSGKQVMGEQD